MSAEAGPPSISAAATTAADIVRVFMGAPFVNREDNATTPAEAASFFAVVPLTYLRAYIRT
jgi:hypothetical protein